jgi:class 3 adenylate cyclase
MSSVPILMTFAVAMVFIFTILMFLVYNRLVEKRQYLILRKAAHSTAIVSSLFPKQVRDRLLQENDEQTSLTSGNRLKKFLSSDPNNNGQATSSLFGSQIADLFPHCTVLFADIAGFTAWSSTRGPEHVFILLQTVYQGFDQVAKRRRIFKVETIGDCYLAVAGLPDPQPNHALMMARFACECRLKINQITKELEVSLGPDCGELRMRFGMNSGPVTAGVLRGDRARFQLFGDTVNTGMFTTFMFTTIVLRLTTYPPSLLISFPAARMESTGMRDKIQISQSTADLLMKAGKGHWLKEREDIVEAKGKGRMTTFWLNPTIKNSGNSSFGESNSQSDSGESFIAPEMTSALNIVKNERYVVWMVELLVEHIKKIVSLKTL